MPGSKEQKVIAGPLADVRILNIGSSIVGPWAASLLGYLGADVIKVEPPKGEYMRQVYPRQKGLATCYTSTNVNQRSAELDLKNPREFAVLKGLAYEADILIENFRASVADRIGIGHDVLQTLNPRLVFASSTGWGDTGPMGDLAALDSHLQAFTGFGSLNGVPGGPAEMIRFAHLDPSAATFFAGAILLGLLERERFGHACWIRTSHLANVIAQQNNRIAEGLLAGQAATRLGSASAASAPNQCFETLDHKYIALACETQAQWEGLCRAIGHEDLIDDPRFASNIGRVEHRQALAELLDGIIGAKPARWWVVRFEAEAVPHGFSLDFAGLRHHEQIVKNEYLTTIIPRHTGPMLVGGLPWTFSETQACIDTAAGPGQHTAQVTATGFRDRAKTPAKTPSAEIQAPLTDLTVIDTTQGYAGPYLGLLLAEAGADVIKIEPPGGDWSRRLAPQTPSGNSALFEAFNRNKQTMTLDLDIPSDRESLRRLVDDAAVLLEDWGSGVAGQRNLGYTSLAESNPGLVYLALSPFGEKGPLRDRPASELIIQAMTGMLRVLGALDQPPLRVGADIASTCAAAMAFVGVLAALYHRERIGRGQRVASSLFGSMMAIRTNQWAAMSDPDEWLGSTYCTGETDQPRYGYQTRDKAIFMTPATTLQENDFVSMLGEFGMREAFSKQEDLKDNWWHSFGLGLYAQAAQPLWDKYLGERSAQEVLEVLSRYDVWAVEFSDLAELMNHPQVRAIDIVHTHGDQKYVRAPWLAPWGLPPLRTAAR